VSEWTVAIGVDTHKRTHFAVGLDRLGNQLDVFEIEVDESGYERLWCWASALGQCAFSIEGAGSYGAGLARFLSARGACVYECERPRRRGRGRGKSDARDALLAARRLLAPEQGLSHLRGEGVREALRVLLLERRSADQARTATLNQLHALAVTAPDRLRIELVALKGERLARCAANLELAGEREDALLDVFRRLGRRALALGQELQDTERQLERLVAEHAATLLAECGVGPMTAAQLLVSSGDPRRMRRGAPSPRSPAQAPSRPPVDRASGTDSTAAAIGS
jgi:transposase